MQSATEFSDEHSLSRLHTYGIYARTTNAMLHTTDLSEFKSLVMEFMTELQLTGYIRFFDNAPSKTAIRFGLKPEHFIFNHALAIQNFMNSEQKLLVHDNCVLFASAPVFAFCGFNPSTKTDIESLQDILTLFFDTLTNWLEQWALKDGLMKQLQHTLDDTIDANEQLIERYLSTSESLTADVTQNLLKLHLTAEQEEFILDALHQSSLKQAHLMEQEIQRNTSLGDALIAAVSELSNPQPLQQASRISSVELF